MFSSNQNEKNSEVPQGPASDNKLTPSIATPEETVPTQQNNPINSLATAQNPAKDPSAALNEFKETVRKAAKNRRKHIKRINSQNETQNLNKKRLDIQLGSWKKHFSPGSKSPVSSDSDNDSQSLFSLKASQVRMGYFKTVGARSSSFLSLYQGKDSQFYVEPFISTAALDEEAKIKPSLINEKKNPRGFMCVITMKKSEENLATSRTEFTLKLADFIGTGTITDHLHAVDLATEAVAFSGEVYFKDNQLFHANTKSKAFNNSGENIKHLPDNALQREIFEQFFGPCSVWSDGELTQFPYKSSPDKFCIASENDEAIWVEFMRIGYYDQLLTGDRLQSLTERILLDDTLIPALQARGMQSMQDIAAMSGEKCQKFIEEVLLSRIELIDIKKSAAEIKQIWDARIAEANLVLELKSKLIKGEFNFISPFDIKLLISRLANNKLKELSDEFGFKTPDDIDKLLDDKRLVLKQVLVTLVDCINSDIKPSQQKNYFEFNRAPDTLNNPEFESSLHSSSSGEIERIETSVQGKTLSIYIPEGIERLEVQRTPEKNSVVTPEKRRNELESNEANKKQKSYITSGRRLIYLDDPNSAQTEKRTSVPSFKSTFSPQKLGVNAPGSRSQSMTQGRESTFNYFNFMGTVPVTLPSPSPSPNSSPRTIQNSGVHSASVSPRGNNGGSLFNSAGRPNSPSFFTSDAFKQLFPPIGEFKLQETTTTTTTYGLKSDSTADDVNQNSMNDGMDLELSQNNTLKKN